MKIKISSDSTCDLSPEQIARYDVEIVPLAVAMGGKDHRDGVDIRPEDIYRYVAQGGDLPKTAANNIADYQQVFRRYTKQYDAVIHLTISSEFSSCYQNACAAAEDFDNVYVVDSRSLSTGHGLLVLQAWDLAEAGKTGEEIAECLRAMTEQVEASFIVNQLDYLKMGGRCSALTALGANLLKLKPCIEVKDGKMGVGKKYRGTLEKAMREYIRDRLDQREDLNLNRIFVTHSGVAPELEKLAVNTVRELQPFREICVTRAGCTVSSHCGPDTIGVLFLRK